MIEEFEIEKVESLNYDELANQLQYIFKTEQDIVNFVNFLKDVKNFVNLSNNKRHSCLIDLAYFRSQIQLFEKKIQTLINKKKLEQTRMAIKKAKGIGEKITENIIDYYTEDNNVLDNLISIHSLVLAWSAYMNDLYFMCGQTSKNLGGLS